MSKSMKIYLPTSCKDLNLSDRQKVFCWLMLETSHALKNTQWPQYTYNFYKQDINHILGTSRNSSFALGHKYTNAGPYEELSEIFEFGFVSTHSFLVRWKKYKLAGRTGKNRRYMAKYIDEISDPDVIMMLMYLMGRFVGDSIFSDEVDTIREKEYPKNIFLNNMYKSYYHNYELRKAK